MKVVLSVILVLAATVGAARGDVVYLLDGKVYEGDVISKGKKVVVRIEYADVELDRNDIRQIVEAPVTTRPAEQPPSPPAVRRPDGTTYPLWRAKRPEPIVFMLMRQLAHSFLPQNR